MPAEPRQRRSRAATAALAWGAVLLVALGAAAAELLWRFPSAPGPGSGDPLVVEIPRGVGPRQLAGLLAEAGAVGSPDRFALWLRVTKRLPLVKTGRFTLRGDMTPHEILEIIASSDEGRGIRVTVPEGFDLGRIAEALADARIGTAPELLAAARDPALLLELGIPGASAEGFLFPDTYFFAADDGAEAAVRKMHARFEEKLAALGPPKGTDLKTAITLASIVQAETGLAEEMPIVAGVYRNRLTRPDFPSRLLQADPTVAYGCAAFLEPKAPSCARFGGRLARSQLDDPENPYNTYEHPGLPPGPICSPGADALAAALRPADVPYLYFVAGPNGRHRFSKTLAEHAKAVELYRKGL
jgi:UPF0755 protein